MLILYFNRCVICVNPFTGLEFLVLGNDNEINSVLWFCSAAQQFGKCARLLCG